MKKFFVLFSIFIITLIAFYDAKERLAELDTKAANTPAQVEMRQNLEKPESNKTDSILNKDILQNDINKPEQPYKQDQLDKIDKRRETIKNQIDWQKN